MGDPKKKGDQEVVADIPKSAFEEALRAVETIQKRKKVPNHELKKASPAKKSSRLSLDLDDDADDLDSLLKLLEASGAPSSGSVPKSVRPSKNTPAPQTMSNGDSILADLLREEQALEKEVDFLKRILLDESTEKVAAGPQMTKEERATPDAKLMEAHAKTEEQKEKINQMSERLARLQAEFENYRKRVSREAQEAKKYYTDQLILQLLPIVDNFELAIGHLEKTANQQSMLEGVQLIYRQILGTLEASGLRTIDTHEEKFDPLYHEAVAVIYDTTVEAGTILTEYQTGYLLNERLLRPSRVTVSTLGESQSSMRGVPISEEESAEATVETNHENDQPPSHGDSSEQAPEDEDDENRSEDLKTNG